MVTPAKLSCRNSRDDQSPGRFASSVMSPSSLVDHSVSPVFRCCPPEHQQQLRERKLIGGSVSSQGDRNSGSVSTGGTTSESNSSVSSHGHGVSGGAGGGAWTGTRGSGAIERPSSGRKHSPVRSGGAVPVVCAPTRAGARAPFDNWSGGTKSASGGAADDRVFNGGEHRVGWRAEGE